MGGTSRLSKFPPRSLSRDHKPHLYSWIIRPFNRSEMTSVNCFSGSTSMSRLTHRGKAKSRLLMTPRHPSSFCPPLDHSDGSFFTAGDFWFCRAWVEYYSLSICQFMFVLSGLTRYTSVPRFIAHLTWLWVVHVIRLRGFIYFCGRVITGFATDIIEIRGQL